MIIVHLILKPSYKKEDKPMKSTKRKIKKITKPNTKPIKNHWEVNIFEIKIQIVLNQELLNNLNRSGKKAKLICLKDLKQECMKLQELLLI